MLVLYGSVGLHRHQEATYGRSGRIGFSTTFIGYSLMFIGEAFAEVMFPLDHPLHTLGGLFRWLALPVILAGLGIWGMASLRSRSLPIWAAPAPLAMAFLWFLVRFPLHDFFLDNVPIWAASGVVTQAIIAGGLGLLGLVLWSSDRSSSAPAAED